MQSAHTEIITVSREFGAGGSELARKLGERLGWPVLDDEVACRCAQRLRLETTAVERLREHSPTLIARLSAALMVAPPEASGIDFSDMLHIDAIAEAAYASIMEAATNLPLIVVGFGTQCIFASRPNALHVRLVAPMASRVARLRDRLGWDTATAAKRAQRMDDDRRRYVQHYFHRDVRDPLLYDIQINTGRTSIDEAAILVEHLVRGVHAATFATVGRSDDGGSAIA